MGWMEAKAFLSSVVAWPGGNTPGYVNLHYSMPNRHGGKDIVTGKPFSTPDDLINYAQWAAAKPNFKEMWYCTSLQSDAGMTNSGKPKAVRFSENAVSLKAIWIDIDVKDDPKHYKTIAEAWTAFVKFRKDTNLPEPSAVVKSGGGMHIYWFSDRPLSPDEWAPFAHGLKSLLVKHNLKCDAGLTTDSVRLLRVPNTLNYKYNPPRPVELLPLPLTEYDFEGVLNFLKTLVPVPASAASFTVPASFTGAKPIFFGTDSLADGTESTPPIPFEPVVKGCAFIRNALITGGKDYAQPLWNLTTLAATFMEEGHALAHRMGRLHPQYTPETTDQLWERKNRERADRGLGWPSCNAIQANGCSDCAACPHFAAGGKSPLSITATVKPVAPPAAIQLNLPDTFTVDADGCICKTDWDPRKKREVDFKLFHSKIDVPWAQKDATRDILHFRATHDKNNYIDAYITLEEMCGGNAGTVLGTRHVKIYPPNKRYLEEFFVAWLDKLHRAQEAQQSQPYGWMMDGSEYSAFVYGGTTYHKDGTESPSGLAGARISDWYRPEGELQPWFDACDTVTSIGRPELDAIIVASFAAPLMVFSGQRGAILSAWGKSGSSKTSAHQVGLAVWGNPQKTKETIQTTPKSLLNKMGQICNLPTYWDEITNEDAQAKAAGVVLSITNGVEPGRLMSSIEQRDKGIWSTLLTISANCSMVEYVGKKDKTHNGSTNRLFEYEVLGNDPKTHKLISPTVAARTINGTDTNYGVMGREYSKYLALNVDRINKEVGDLCTLVENELGVAQEDRFWSATIGILLSGAKYANDIGAKFDVVSLKKFLYKVYASNKSGRAEAALDGSTLDQSEALLCAYLKARANTQTIWTAGLPIKHPGRPPVTAVELKHGPPATLNTQNGVQVRWDVPTRTLRFSRPDFHKWLIAEGYANTVTVTNNIHRHFGMKKAVKMILAAGTRYRTAFPEWVFEITVPTGTAMEDVLMMYEQLAAANVVTLPTAAFPTMTP